MTNPKSSLVIRGYKSLSSLKNKGKTPVIDSFFSPIGKITPPPFLMIVVESKILWTLEIF